ncbi:MAG: hypothetical protein O6940_01730 [Ignavibacteria bacterium]|nr:hypothetical protein [Ignavibacteria bacterium]
MKLITISLIAIIGFIMGCKEQTTQDDEIVEYLMVQNSEDVQVTSNSLTLIGISPTTIFFSDRPKRIVGHVYTEDVITIWSEGKDKLSKDPPNATLSIFGENEIVDLVVELKNPKMEEDKFTYDIILLDGEIPDFGGRATLFIDPVGMPLTPVSVAGVTRRAVRRRAIY